MGFRHTVDTFRMPQSRLFNALCAASFIVGGVHADGLYAKSSAVLQVDGKSYDKVVAKSNLVSVSYNSPLPIA